VTISLPQAVRRELDKVAKEEGVSRSDVLRQSLEDPLAGWMNRRLLEVIEYLREENRVLKEHLGGQRLHFTDPQRRRIRDL